jgi:hypothetical protein
MEMILVQFDFFGKWPLFLRIFIFCTNNFKVSALQFIDTTKTFDFNPLLWKLLRFIIATAWNAVVCTLFNWSTEISGNNIKRP